MKKYLQFGLIVSVFMILGALGATVLFAESINSGPGSMSGGNNASPMILNIGPYGNVLIRGIVVGAPGVDSIKVKSWGGVWEVKVSTATKLVSVNKVIADFQDGDFVGVLGTISSDGSFIVDASIVREWMGKLNVRDADKDGIPNDQDSDDDNDGIPDLSDPRPFDGDNDGLSDDLDSDDDDDGIEDSKDSKHGDHDNDGIRDSRDRDDDNDNIPDISDLKPRNHDNDDQDDSKDIDDDNDGKNDDEDEDDDNDGKVDDDEGDDNSNSGRGN